MSGASVAFLPANFLDFSQPDPKKFDIEAKTPGFTIKSRCSRPAKNVTAFAFVTCLTLSILVLTTGMQIVPQRATFDPHCSPATIDIKTITYRSKHRFYSMIKDIKALPAPLFREKHEVLCTRYTLKSEYCLPITTRDDAVFCNGADRIDLLIRQSPSTLCLASVLHLILSDVFEELQEVNAFPSIYFTSRNLESQDTSLLNATIAYNSDITLGASFDTALQQKGYHLFQHDDKWQVCVAPTHPLASHLYDPKHTISNDMDLIPHIDLLNRTEIISDTLTVFPHIEENCSPDNIDVRNSEFQKINRFYAMMGAIEPLPPPVFQGEHKTLCSDQDRDNRGFHYCLPITGLKSSSFCAGADRMDLLARPTRSTRCFASILHLLLMDVYDELEANGLNPLLTFGTLLGAIRNGSVIPFTEDVDIAYSGSIISNGALGEALWRKGYHLFMYGIWRVCVAPIHPLASILYDPEQPIPNEYEVPYVDLYSMKKLYRYANEYWKMDEAKELIPKDQIEPFSQVTINGLPFNTISDPHSLLMKEYGSEYMKPQSREL